MNIDPRGNSCLKVHAQGLVFYCYKRDQSFAVQNIMLPTGQQMMKPVLMMQRAWVDADNYMESVEIDSGYACYFETPVWWDAKKKAPEKPKESAKPQSKIVMA